MAITFKHALAKDFLREQAKIASENNSDLFWLEEIERLSSLCEAGCPKTHIAFLGAALLAKALNQKVDLYAIKPTQRPDNPNAFSARSLAHSVLVPLSAELGIHLGVTGREPLNNQPYFRMKWLNDDTPIRADGRQAFDLVLGLIERLSAHTRDEALSALRSFIVVRMRYQPRYGTLDGDIEISPSKLIECIQALSKNFSEGGKVAQAIAAGVLDVIEGMDFIESGRINDPDRRFPGDVCVKSQDGSAYLKAFEVRDKPVSLSDIHIFGKKCVDMGVREAAVLMVNEKQRKIDQQGLSEWAQGYGIGVTLFYGWAEFVNQVLFWTDEPKPDAAKIAIKTIHDRLIQVEASPNAVASWKVLATR